MAALTSSHSPVPAQIGAKRNTTRKDGALVTKNSGKTEAICEVKKNLLRHTNQSTETLRFKLSRILRLLSEPQWPPVESCGYRGTRLRGSSLIRFWRAILCETHLRVILAAMDMTIANADEVTRPRSSTENNRKVEKPIFQYLPQEEGLSQGTVSKTRSTKLLGLFEPRAAECAHIRHICHSNTVRLRELFANRAREHNKKLLGYLEQEADIYEHHSNRERADPILGTYNSVYANNG
ncbi:hypothetical protein ASPBRDRAFT_32050 [Aspergillus brasiliensis CBS 101740]|uniref:Uncharacterized protein n=1 Tax=Aspergillus brasiliensis (strain CBS 101740 / IMI 381727 / IBT 21946) TaxID=767769 RepID=A0A1L9UET6_ASPBC|nr:hypothetical protein ASPBRDRAFT_32050 [Aspergillus brasiliensis CBS 101740]